MFGRKSKLEKLRANAQADFLRCKQLDPSDRYNRMFVSRTAMRAKGNLDKIFVQGARAEEKRQQDLARSMKDGKKGFPQRGSTTDTTPEGTTGVVLPGVPEEYANTMFNLGADYQIQKKVRANVLPLPTIAEKDHGRIANSQKIELLNLLRLAITTADTNEETEN